jgi:hypothetical protein
MAGSPWNSSPYSLPSTNRTLSQATLLRTMLPESRVRGSTLPSGGIQPHRFQPCSAVGQPPALANAFAHPGSCEQYPPNQGQRHVEDDQGARKRGQAAAHKHELSQPWFRREDGLESG